LKKPTAQAPELQLDIDRLAYGGDGVGHHNGKVVFVPGALPGERVLVRLEESKKRYDRARLVSVLIEAPDRRAGDCEVEALGCGGCGLRHVEASVSLNKKAESALDEMRKLSKQVFWPEPTLVPAFYQHESRARARLHVRHGKIGFFIKGSSRSLVEILGCRALDPKILDLLGPLTEAVEGLQHLELTVEVVSGARYLYADGDTSPTFEARVAQWVRGGVIAGFGAAGRPHHLGEEWMIERTEILGRGVHSARKLGTFGQASPEMNNKLRKRLAEAVDRLRPKRILELYAGSGNLTLAATGSGRTIVAVELDGPAVQSLRKTIKLNGLGESVRIVEADLRAGLPHELEGAFDMVIMDPPRTGASEVMSAVAALKPKTVLYVSCAPTTLARDVGLLAPHVFIEKLDVFDMFPMTPHVEMMAQLSLVDD